MKFHFSYEDKLQENETFFFLSLLLIPQDRSSFRKWSHPALSFCQYLVQDEHPNRFKVFAVTSQCVCLSSSQKNMKPFEMHILFSTLWESRTEFLSLWSGCGRGGNRTVTQHRNPCMENLISCVMGVTLNWTEQKCAQRWHICEHLWAQLWDFTSVHCHSLCSLYS